MFQPANAHEMSPVRFTVSVGGSEVYSAWARSWSRHKVYLTNGAVFSRSARVQLPTRIHEKTTMKAVECVGTY